MPVNRSWQTQSPPIITACHSHTRDLEELVWTTPINRVFPWPFTWSFCTRKPMARTWAASSPIAPSRVGQGCSIWPRELSGLSEAAIIRILAVASLRTTTSRILNMIIPFFLQLPIPTTLRQLNHQLMIQTIPAFVMTAIRPNMTPISRHRQPENRVPSSVFSVLSSHICPIRC